MAEQPLWQPSAEQLAATTVSDFMVAASKCAGQTLSTYQALWQWSVDDTQAFWSLVWDYCQVIGDKGAVVLDDADLMPGAKWFPEARLNYAENLLRKCGSEDAIAFWGEDKVKRRLSHDELYSLVSRCRQALVTAGVQQGDRVAGFLPNMPETVVAMLATTSLGAVWSSASPDFGTQGVIDRFGQIQPKVLFCVDGYYYNGKIVDCMEKNRQVTARLDSLVQTVVVPYTRSAGDSDEMDWAAHWHDYLRPYRSDAIDFARVSFNDPLVIMFSSGTTGAPKCIVHSVGGTLLQHLKEHRLHADVRAGDRLFYFTTCGWMMWNWLVAGLASEATLLLYDGSPFAGEKQILFDYADAEEMTQLGTSAKYIETCGKYGLQPRLTHRLDALRSIFSTGSPLAPEGFRYIYASVKADVQLASISGGTDILSCFALGSPILPVWIGELQCRGLGMAVDVYDGDGRPLREDKGELVCTRPFPCMPIGFWNDVDGSRYRAAYFETFPGVWAQGDFAEITAHDGLIIHGRSDATLNPGGVRIGTAEIYRQVEQIDDVLESIVIGQSWSDDVRVVLFVILRDGTTLNEELVQRIKQKIRSGASPRHVPAKVIQVDDIPRTKSGKITELAVRDVIAGRRIKNLEALANPNALELYRDIPELQT